eukprot:gnl/Dysnectes_brevis/6304_a9682_312.p1 GENE.gnl/Dysnectes_brevis/6304_a9682_312~~gnl/Dysnectes_brevis/6304_a9682_312.p1  ORF type:complete len:273 (+),score=30.17 gnl/Dysnectes_brevis/6304_a9682_312:162-980(+)
MRFKLRVPAKVILFGEHAVVYNQPAIVCAIDSYTSATVTIHASPFCMINLKYQNVFDDHFEVTYSESTSLSPNTQPISEHNHPEWLIALSTLAEHFLFPKSSILIDINSHVPLSAGLGSSASIFVLLAASLHLSSSSHDSDHLTLTQEDLLAVNAAAHAAERVIHGPAASGVDNTVITHGGCIRYQSGSSVPLPSLPLSMALGYCGRQKGSTREMVERAGLHFATADGTKDLEAFRSVTKSAILEFKKPDVSPSWYARVALQCCAERVGGCT